MPSLPPAIVPLLSTFATLFDARTWRKAQILLTGVVLAPGRCTVSRALYALGLQGRGDFALYHHVLSQASWSSLVISWVVLGGEDRGPGSVSGPGPLVPRPFCQGQGAALGQPDAVGQGLLGPPDAVRPAPLAPRPGAGGRRGPDLRDPAAAGRLPAHDPAHHLPDPAAPGCGPP